MPKRADNEKELKPFDLKAARKSRKLSQISVADLLATSQASITRWERDGNMPLIYRKYWNLFWEVEDVKAQKDSNARHGDTRGEDDTERSQLAVGGTGSRHRKLRPGKSRRRD